MASLSSLRDSLQMLKAAVATVEVVEAGPSVAAILAAATASAAAFA